MAIALRYAARSDVGLVRPENQDGAYAGPHLLVVADGMGGHAGGDIASSLAVAELAPLDGESHGGEALTLLTRAVAAADAAIRARALAEPKLAGMGTTVTAMLRTGNRLALAHIGDSRAYLLRDGTLSQITKDHSFVQTLVDEGRITREEAEHHPQRNLVMRVLKGDDDEPDTSVREARAGDRYLLCSDGLSGVVSDETLTEALSQGLDPGPTADRLVQLALRAGATDNVTVVVADVVDLEGSGPSSTPEVVGSSSHVRPRGTGAQSSPAAKAAALGRTADQDEDPDPDPGRQGLRRSLRIGGLVVVLALVLGGGWGAYAWSQSQYFVGAADNRVAVYRGLTQDIGPISLSRVEEDTDTEVADLPRFHRQRVEQRIVADDLVDARRITGDLAEIALACVAAAGPPVVATPAPTATPSTPGPTATPSTATPSTATPSTGPGASTPATPEPSATSDSGLVVSCAGIG